MELYEVTVEYVKYLRKFEPTKIMSNADGKEQRKFLGVIVQKNGYKYVIPLSSPKYKKDYKIRDYQGENLPEDFSFVAYADRIILLKDTNVPVVYMYENSEEPRLILRSFCTPLGIRTLDPLIKSQLLYQLS